MGKTPESKVRDPVVKYAKGRGIRHIRMHFGYGVSTGCPDDLFLIPGGRPLFIEFKPLGREPTKKQQLKIDQLIEAGYDAEWHDTVLFATVAIDEAMERADELKKPRLAFRKTKYKDKK